MNSTDQVAGKIRRGWLLFALLALLVAGGYWAWSYRQTVSARPEFRTASIARGSLTASVSATGTVNPVVSVQVGSQVSGQIRELFVDYN
ncbi:MAG: hypothetical protein VW257_01275, partial [Quisquiliibacterium sp.]